MDPGHYRALINIAIQLQMLSREFLKLRLQIQQLHTHAGLNRDREGPTSTFETLYGFSLLVTFGLPLCSYLELLYHYKHINQVIQSHATNIGLYKY